jgi:deoxynucleotidyltransferase terminal-interacting protein 1
MDEERFSPSPSPLPSMAQSIDALVSQMTSHPAPSSSRLAMQAQFGVTAYCPRSPILPPSSASPAPLDMTAQNFPKRSKYAHRAAVSAMHPYQRTRGGGVNVAKTLDLLKAVLQSSFNMEVKRLCDDYLQLYSQAAANIKENTGDTVPEATLRLLVNKMLEEAQHGYQKGEWEFPSSKLPRNEKVAPAKASPMANKKAKGEKGETRYGPPKRSRRPPADHQQTGSEKTSWKWSMDKKRVDPGKWKPDTLSPETYFVLGVNVNKALGHGANRGKVYYLHPELFKYACDGDDKTWLYENKLLPVHGGKAFLMILKEVKFLVGSEECYMNNKEIMNAVRKLQEFQVPQFMLDKMKTFMRSVQGYFAQEASSASSSAQTASNSVDSSTSDAATQNS